ncbi:hypothetical protein PSHT_04937 [Puccinia striiformis]|uniref:Uncharacterized protein n=1 Tax=Puccinia striiformis TaxID=27350 RepID=A0A2S4WBR3_9BASI|nr:hypothetical protein PSHT_04937 [Puccinia striiformis]
MSKLASPILPDKGPFSALRESLRPGADERPRTKHRSNSDGSQLPSHFSSAKVGHVNASSIPGRSLNRAVDGEPRSNYRPGDHPPVEPTSSRRQQTTGDVHKHVPLPVVHVRRSQEGRRQSSHESCSEPGDIEPGAYLLNAERRIDDGVFPEKRASNSLTTSATQASTSTPSHQPGRSSPQEDVVMTYRDPAPVQATAQPASLILSAPPEHSQLGLCTSPKPRAEPRSTSRSIRDERVELREPEHAANDSFEPSTKLCSELCAGRDERSSSEPCAKRNGRPSAELRAKLYDTVSAKPQPVYV